MPLSVWHGKHHKGRERQQAVRGVSKGFAFRSKTELLLRTFPPFQNQFLIQFLIECKNSMLSA
jgi:hypothetical protein